MSRPTRRDVLAGTLAGAAGSLLAAAPASAATPPAGLLPARAEVVRRGRAIAGGAGGRVLVVAHERRRTVGVRRGSAGKETVIDVGGHPVEAAVAPGGERAVVTTGWWDEPGLAVLDLADRSLRRRIAVGPAPGAVAYADRGRTVVVAGGEQEGTVCVLDARSLKTLAERPVGRVPRGLGVAPDGRSVWLALQGDDRVVCVDARTGRVRRAVRTPALPDRVAVSPDGRRLLITHAGPEAHRVTELDVVARRVRRHEAGRLPSAVAWTRRGERLVALGGEDDVLVLGSRPRRIGVGPAPRGLVVAGRRLWTVSHLTGAVRGGRL